MTGVVAALSERLPKQKFVESADLEAGEAPAVVVFVVSAAATLTESDCALLDAAAAETDAVIGVVSKIDVHRNWEEVLAGDREVLASHAPRYRDVPWVGVAAAPESGEPRIDDLVAAVSDQLADEDLAAAKQVAGVEVSAADRRRPLRSRRRRRGPAGAGRRAARTAQRDPAAATAVQVRADDRAAQPDPAGSGSAVVLRPQPLRLGAFRAAGGRREPDQGQAAGVRVPRGRALNEVIAEVDDGTTTHLADIAQGLGLTVDPPAPAPLPTVELPAPQLKSRKLETRLMMLLGAGFGLGVALTLSRLLADLTPGLTVAGAVACAAIGLALTVWVVGIRGLLRDRALLDRWVGEATALAAVRGRATGGDPGAGRRVVVDRRAGRAGRGRERPGRRAGQRHRHRTARALRRRGAGRGAARPGDADAAGRSRGGAGRTRRSRRARPRTPTPRPTMRAQPSETSVPADDDAERN